MLVLICSIGAASLNIRRIGKLLLVLPGQFFGSDAVFFAQRFRKGDRS